MTMKLWWLVVWSYLVGLASCDNADWKIQVHRNGEPIACGVAAGVPFTDKRGDKYSLESFLTSHIHQNLDDTLECGSMDNDTAVPLGLLGFCDMGPERTPILLDHNKLVRVQPADSLPCRWYTREGLRISSLEQLFSLAEQTQTCANVEGETGCDNDDNLHLYAVPAGRVFMFAPSYVGEIFDLTHLLDRPEPDVPVYLKVLSLNPRVFDIFHAFAMEEADDIVQRALEETSPSHRLHRSTTGTTEYSIFSKRTSENAFDTHGRTAMALKQRIFTLLGFDEYWHGHDDGLQVLRYNMSKAYVQHMDYLTDRSGQTSFNYDSAGKGGNRFATVLLYMTDLPPNGGGETVFSEAWPPELEMSERQSMSESLEALRASGDAMAAGIEEGSWEEEMVALCRSKLAVKPWRGRAVLFYSQLPSGEPDQMSKHGGCPVLQGSKWAANLWVWNTPRANHEGAPYRDDMKFKDPAQAPNMPEQLHVTFRNLGKDPQMKNAEVWYDEAMFWGKLGHGDPPLAANTFEGHRWNIRVDGDVVKKIVIGKDKRQVVSV